jgi:uncharacterized protein
MKKFGRTGYLLLGLLFSAIGILGAILPLLPSTCFFIIASYYFGMSSERLEKLLLNHPRIGPVIHSWRTYKAIPKFGKIMACCGMSVSALIMIFSPAPMFVKVGVLCGLALSAWYVISRPSLEDIVYLTNDRS